MSTKRSPTDEIEIEGEILQCPINGCSRLFVDNRGGLYNHVLNQEDEAHRNKKLNENLEIVTDWEAMEWGW